MVVRDDENSPWKKHEACPSDKSPVQDDNTGSLSRSVPCDPCPASEERAAKRRKVSDTTSTCLAPPISLIAKAIFECDSTTIGSTLGAGDIFLTDGWRQRWCRCDKVSRLDLRCGTWIEGL